MYFFFFFLSEYESQLILEQYQNRFFEFLVNISTGFNCQHPCVSIEWVYAILYNIKLLNYEDSDIFVDERLHSAIVITHDY